MAFSSRYRRAFTLVELLVVIGIIALLIALLMPTLGLARQQAQRVSCAAKLHNIMIAAQIHCNDHKGFYPLAGVIPGWQPADLDDLYSSKYSYMTDKTDSTGQFSPYVAPITIALASEMSYRVLAVDNPNDLAYAETDDRGFIRNFLCPSQASSVLELPQLPMLYIAAKQFSIGPIQYNDALIYWEQQSYNFNEAVLGWTDNDTSNRLKGQASQIRQPAKTMFVADGLMGNAYESRAPAFSMGYGMATFYNIAPNPPVTLADAFRNNGIAGDLENFDTRRHRHMMNIAFCDSHVETRNISVNDLNSVYLLAP